ncbi:MAG: P-loop NTPase family protein, partial [Acidithiobacillus ferrivorans]
MTTDFLTSVAAASPELTGGVGFTFEDGVAAVYAAALISETTAPGLPGRWVKSLSVQHGPLGHPLDDVIVEGVGADGVSIRLSLQVKRHITISAAATNTDFRDTVLRAHATISEAGFNVGLDRVGIATGEIAEGSKRDFETLCEWARSEHDSAQFRTKLHTDGVAGNKQTFFDAVRGILSTKLPEVEIDAATHNLLSHFVLIRFDLMHEGSVTESQTVASLANHLQPSERARADDLWRRLLALVRVAEGHAASFDRKTIVARLNGAFRLAGAPSLQEALARIGAEARLAANEIPNDIGGVSISRGRFVQSSRTALTRHRFVQIGGLPGTGKSVVLRALVEEAIQNGPVLFLKADRLTGATWSQYSTAQSIGSAPLEDLLVELASVGTPVVFVDGLDRIDAHHRGILTDIFNTILDSDTLSSWQVVASVRDTGIEPVRTWLPRKLLDAGAAVIDVSGFDDDEARTLAQSKPALAPLLFGAKQVRAIVRRPFFAGVLIRRHPSDTNAPSSEIELATAWWAGGGYGADPTRAGHRRNILVELARQGAPTLGKRIPILGVDPQVLVELEADGIIRQVRAGHSVDFVHDIYFEWSFLQLLVSQGGQWLDVIRQVGEPPILGRTVELFSQSEFKDGNDWQGFLERLESATDVRSQWLRAWMVGPFGLPSFQNY